MNAQFRNEVENRLRQQGLHHVLQPIYSSIHQIPERLYEYNPDMFIVRNLIDRRYEVHSLANKERTHCISLTFDELDERTIRHVWSCDIRVHGDKLFEEIERKEQEYEKRQERERKEWVRDMAKETQSLFAKTAWT